MSEENATLNANVEQVASATTTEVETSTEETLSAEQQAASATATEGQPTETPEQGSEPSGAEKRIKQLVAKNHELEQQLQILKQIQDVQVALPPQVEKPVEPVLEKFETYQEYETAVREYDRKLTAYEVTQSNIQRTQAVRQQQVEVIFQSRMAIEAATDPEILNVAKDPTLPISPAMASIIKESDMGPKLIRYFNDNRQEANLVRGMDPISAARMIGKIEAKLSVETPKPEVKVVSQAPAPVKTVSAPAASKLTIADESLPIEEFMKRRNAKQFNKRG